VYVYDVLTRSNSLVSRSFITGQAASGHSDFPDISADGRYIVYQSEATDIAPQDNNGRAKDIFLYDRLSSSTMLLSASAYGTGTGDFESQSPSFTGDGQTIAFQSWASDLTVNDFNQGSDLFLYKILNLSNSTNPPPVLTGQILFSPGTGSGSGTGQSTPQLRWVAAPGFGYQVQYKTNLTDDTWLPVSGGVVIQNGVGYVNDLTADPDHRFYRVVAY
jgi:Tol biopolymer transport system component